MDAVTSLELLGGRTPRRRGLGAWPVVLGVVALLVVGVVAASAPSLSPRVTDGLPERISVHDRDYRHGARLTAAQVTAQRGEWRSLGRVGPRRSVLYDVDPVPGLTVTGLVVEPSPGTYVSYSLMGAP